MLAAVLLLMHVCHVPEIKETQVDMIEVNHNIPSKVHQVIFWEWSEGRWTVVAWRFIEKSALPTPDGRGWRVTWMDEKQMRTVYARICIESITSEDPEVANRKILPQHKRRGLWSELIAVELVGQRKQSGWALGRQAH